MRAVGLVVAFLSVCPTVRLSSQGGDPRLQAAVQLAHAGRTDSARAGGRRLLRSPSPPDSAYPPALYTQGILASAAATAATSLQRVVGESGWSPWADAALLRLAQLYWAEGAM